MEKKCRNAHTEQKMQRVTAAARRVVRKERALGGMEHG